MASAGDDSFLDLFGVAVTRMRAAGGRARAAGACSARNVHGNGGGVGRSAGMCGGCGAGEGVVGRRTVRAADSEFVHRTGRFVERLLLLPDVASAGLLIGGE